MVSGPPLGKVPLWVDSRKRPRASCKGPLNLRISGGRLYGRFDCINKKTLQSATRWMTVAIGRTLLYVRIHFL